MFAGVNLTPDFFAQTLELQDREGRRILCREGKDMNNLLVNRSMFSVCPCLDLSVKPIRHFLDIQGGHLLLQNAVIMEERKVWVKRAESKARRLGVIKEFCEFTVERPRIFEFVINLNDVKQIGLTIPPNMLVRADKGSSDRSQRSEIRCQ